jgi:hypothetical protein
MGLQLLKVNGLINPLDLLQDGKLFLDSLLFLCPELLVKLQKQGLVLEGLHSLLVAS